MSDRDMGSKLFVGCFEFGRVDDEALDDSGDATGSFQFVVEAASPQEALAQCKRRLDEIAAESVDPDFPGPSRVFLSVMIELPPERVRNGVLINWSEWKGDTEFQNAVPDAAQPVTAYYPDDFDGLAKPLPDRPLEDGYTVAPIWDGVASFSEKWKLYWCTTADHDEDWFVIARDSFEAEAFHIHAEGYDEDQATAELVCVLPGSEQNIDAPGWPDERTLRACGAEFLPNVPQDGQNALRRQVGSGGRVVRLLGRIYAEGDIVGNVMRRSGDDKCS